jgi:hypothetical protein
MPDPVHPNWDGIAFQATTDKRGVVVTPTSAQTPPPYTYLPLPAAVAVYGDLRAVVYGVEAADAKSYLAHFLSEVCDDLGAAIEACRPAEVEVQNAADTVPRPSFG